MSDIRLNVNFFGHTKARGMRRRLGDGGLLSLVILFCWVGAHRAADGSLEGLSGADIEDAADWRGEPGAFVREALAVRFLEGEEGTYRIHGWAEHQAWLADGPRRKAKALWNNAKRNHGEEEADRMYPEYASTRVKVQKTTSSTTTSTTSSTAKRTKGVLVAPLPSLPFPSLPEEQKQKTKEAAVAAVDPKAVLWAEWKKISGDNGSFLGKMIKQHGEGAVLAKLPDVISKNPAEPKSFLQRALAPNPGRKGRVDNEGYVLDEHGNRTGKRGVVV